MSCWEYKKVIYIEYESVKLVDAAAAAIGGSVSPAWEMILEESMHWKEHGLKVRQTWALIPAP